MISVRKDYSSIVAKDELVIVISFDGSKSPEMWKSTTDFAKEVGGRFTYFVSGVYFITDAEKNRYKYPTNPSRYGISEIGFGGTQRDIDVRKGWIASAVTAGHEMGSHLNGHFDSTSWSPDAMNLELDQFQEFTSFLPKKSRTVRMPLLSFNEGLWEPLIKHGFDGVASLNLNQVSSVVIENSGNKGSECVGFPIPYIDDGRYRQISMDYNLFYYDEHKAPDRTDDEIENLIYLTYKQQARDSVAARMPLFLNHHFQLFKNGAYWNGLKRAVIELCQDGGVRFATFSELTDGILRS